MNITEELNKLSNNYNDVVMEIIYLTDEGCEDLEKIKKLMVMKNIYEGRLKDFKLKHNMHYGVCWKKDHNKIASI